MPSKPLLRRSGGLAPHVEAALFPSQAKSHPATGARVVAAHVRAAIGLAAQAKPAGSGLRSPAPHVQAALAGPRPGSARREPTVLRATASGAATPARRAGAVVQPACIVNFFSSLFSSCFGGGSNQPQQQPQPDRHAYVSLAEVPRSQSLLVDQGDSLTLTPGNSYFPGHLTSCAMVFALGDDGGCVYHWPGHSQSKDHALALRRAMAEARVTRWVGIEAYGLDFGLTNPKRGEYLDTWSAFGRFVQTEIGVAPAIFLCEDQWTNPILKYSGGRVTPVFPAFKTLEELKG